MSQIHRSLRSVGASALAMLLVAACGQAADVGGTKGSTLPPADASTSSDAASDAGAGDDAVAADAAQVNTLVIEPDQTMQPIYNLVSSAKKSLDITLYELDDPTFLGLLTTAAANGVTVRVILDQNLEMQTNQTAYDTLGAANAQVHWANPTYASTHQKTITVDATTSAIMTLNIAASEYKTSRDFAVITTDAADVAAIETTFASDFVNTSFAPTGDNLVWSPTIARSSLSGIINGATASLLVENEEMSDPTIVNALIAAATRRIDVRVVMENSKSYIPDFEALIAAGVKLMVYSHASIYIHAKVILADYGTSTAKVFVGSENFSTASLTDNRELGLITSDPAIMTPVHTTLTSDFTGGTTYHAPDAGAPDSGSDAGTDAASATDGASDAAGDAAGDDGGSGDAAGSD